MLPLDDPRWHELQDAYGAASDIPQLLRQLEAFPPQGRHDSEPYASLWSSLCHQGSVYPASYAAVPHLIRILASAPLRASWDFFVLPASIELGRLNELGPDVPEDLRDSYFAALTRIPALAADAAQGEWDEVRCRGILASVAVVKGQARLGEAILELEPDTVRELFKRKFG